MENSDRSDDDPFHFHSNYGQHVGAVVSLPEWAAGKFSSSDLAVLGAVRDAAYNSSDGTCSLTVKEIARLVKVSPREAVNAISVAIASGIIEREGRGLRNLHIHYKDG